MAFPRVPNKRDLIRKKSLATFSWVLQHGALPAENYCDFTVFVSDMTGKKGLVVEVTSMGEAESGSDDGGGKRALNWISFDGFGEEGIANGFMLILVILVLEDLISGERGTAGSDG